jgi:RsiW-degrading membrane proteinase PrsW (M82 family)
MIARPATARSAPRWGRQASFIAPRQPAFWLFCGLLAIGGLLFVEEQSVMAGLATAWLISWALMLAYAVPVALVIYRLDLFEREPKLMLAAALAWGGVIATSLATYANEAWLSVVGKLTSPDFAAQWGAAIVGPGVEETLKLMGVVALFLIASSEVDGVLDGFVYGAMVGLGFTVVEDVSYFINAVAAVPGSVDQSGPVLDTFLVRVVAGGLYGHVLFAGLTGMGFAYLVTQRAAAMSRRVAVAVLCVAAGVSAHAVWNSPWMDSVLWTSGGASPSVQQWIEYGALKGLPFLILLAVLVTLATRNEERDYRAIVAGEPDPMVVIESEIRSLGSLWLRWSARAAAGRVGGRGAARLVGRLQAAQIEYAMIRSAADHLHDPALEAQRLKIRSIRTQLGVGPMPPRPVGSVPSAPPAFGDRPWAPTHHVPPGGIAVWDAPRAARHPVARISEGVELAVVARTGAWAQVRDAAGRIGWVDGRLLIEG